MSHRKVTYNTSKFADCFDHEGKKLLSFTIRTTDGEDETYAAKRAEATGNPYAEELVRYSLVAYNATEITHPFGNFDKWSSKARGLVVAAWKRLATPDDKELADFLASGTDA